ncbi:MAG: hypothetical protein ACOX4B_05310 [Bacillota bacterium]|jgi:hypothetical protein|nr:hypothetical protein [Candidatus Fermentithermobacillaceae bacterium]
MKKEIPVAITLILAILYVAANYFTGVGFLDAAKERLDRWYLVVAAWAVLVGSINLSQIHGRRISQRREGWVFSVWLLICLFGMMFFGIFIAKNASHPGWTFMYNQLIAPMNATVYSTIVFYIGSAAYRAFRVRSPEASVLLITALIMMLGRVPLGRMLLGGHPALSQMADWILNVPNAAGMRGIQIGACLGGVATALRIALGIERGHLGGTSE